MAIPSSSLDTDHKYTSDNIFSFILSPSDCIPTKQPS